jgi:hypothetical protein
MEKLFAPRREKLDVMEIFMESMDVRIPTTAIIPKAIMRIVRDVRNMWLRIEEREIFRFSSMTTF